MGTPFSKIEERFLRKIQRDEDYFCYNGMDSSQALDIINRRTKNLIIDALEEIDTVQFQNVSFCDYNEETEEVNFDLTSEEIGLVVSCMVYLHFADYLAELLARAKYVNVGKLQGYSPANDRRTVQSLVEDKRLIFANKLDIYNSHDRLTKDNVFANYSWGDE